MADQFYFESDYIAEDYFGYVAEAEISLSGAFSPTFVVAVADNTGYFIPEYIEEGYFSAAVTSGEATLSSQASISLDITKIKEAESDLNSAGTISTTGLRIKQLEADFGALFTPNFTVEGRLNSTAILDSSATLTTTVSPFRDNDSTLNNIVNLSLQGVKTADYASAFSSAFTQTTANSRTRDTSATFNVSSTLLAVTGTLSKASSTQSSSTTLTATVGKQQSATTSISAVATQSANAIEFISKWPANKRPVTWNKRLNGGSTTSSLIDFDQSTVKWNDYSIAIKSGNYGITSTEISNNSYTIPSSTDFAFETWVYFEGENGVSTDSPFILHALDTYYTDSNSLGTGYVWMIGENNAKVEAKLRKNDGTIITITSTQSWGSGSWIHVGLKRSGSTISLTYNGSSIGTATYDGALSSSATSSTHHLVLQHQDQIGSDNDVYFDGLHYQLGSSSFTGQSSNPKGTGTDYTLVLTNFENTFDDDLGLHIALGSESLSSAFSLSLLGGGIFELATLQASAGTLTCDANYQVDNTSSLDSAASLSVETGFLVDFSADFDAFNSQVTAINKIGDTLVALDNVASLTADVNEIVQLESDLSAAFTQSIDENFILDNSADLSSAAGISIDASGGFIGLVPQTMSSAFAQSVDVLRIRPGDVDFDSAFTQSTNAIKAVKTSVTANSAFTQTADAQRLRDVEADFDAFNTQLSAVNKIGQGLMGFDGIFSVSADVRTIAKGGVVLDTNATLEIDFGVIKQGQSSQSSAVSIVINGTSSQDARANLDSAFTQTVDANIIKGVGANVNSAATQTVDATVTRNIDISLTSAFGANITATAFTDFESDLTSQFTQTVNAGKQVEATINFGALFTPSIDYRIIHVDQYVYTIPAETRTYTIINESRSYTVPAETRTYTIQGD